MKNKLDGLHEMSVEEAITKHSELKSLHRIKRLMLLDIRDRKGWLALGYKSWEDYGEIEWGYSVNYLNRITSAEYVQSVISPMSTKEIPERQLRPLTSVPDEIKCAIWRGVAIFAKAFLGFPAQKRGKNYATTNACGCPSRPGHSFATQQGVAHMLSNDSTRFRKACIFTTQTALRENTCPIASGDYSTPVSQRRQVTADNEKVTAKIIQEAVNVWKLKTQSAS